MDQSLHETDAVGYIFVKWVCVFQNLMNLMYMHKH